MPERIPLSDWDAVCEAIVSVFPASQIQENEAEIMFKLSDETLLTVSRDGEVSGSMPLHSFEADDVVWVRPVDDALIVGTASGNTYKYHVP